MNKNLEEELYDNLSELIMDKELVCNFVFSENGVNYVILNLADKT